MKPEIKIGDFVEYSPNSSELSRSSGEVVKIKESVDGGERTYVIRKDKVGWGFVEKSGTIEVRESDIIHNAYEEPPMEIGGIR